jgi:hypothetical protein
LTSGWCPDTSTSNVRVSTPRYTMNLVSCQLRANHDAVHLTCSTLLDVQSSIASQSNPTGREGGGVVGPQPPEAGVMPAISSRRARQRQLADYRRRWRSEMSYMLAHGA